MNGKNSGNTVQGRGKKRRKNTAYSGLNLQDPFETQFIRQLKVLLDQTSRESMKNDVIRANTEQIKIEAGYPGTLEEIPWDIMEPCITDCWLKQLLVSLHKIPLGHQEYKKKRKEIRKNY